jgi:hypothetical protein
MYIYVAVQTVRVLPGIYCQAENLVAAEFQCLFYIAACQANVFQSRL